MGKQANGQMGEWARGVMGKRCNGVIIVFIRVTNKWCWCMKRKTNHTVLLLIFIYMAALCIEKKVVG